MAALLILICLMAGATTCGKKKDEQPIISSPKKAELYELYLKKITEAEARRSKDGWLGTAECDAMLWTGKYSCAAKDVNILPAEYPEQPGRFNRRPAPFFCEVNAGSATSWSRDMGMGLITYAFCNDNLAVLQRHASYGVSKQWKMGEPLDDGRVVYTPSVIGHLYQAIYTLGGADNANRVWPSIYSQGLEGFQAHLQMIDIWLKNEISQRQIDLGLNAGTEQENKKGVQLSISAIMYDRIKEHSTREPLCPFYQYMRGLYDSGQMTETIDLLMGDEWNCTYLHTDDRASEVFLAEWLFVANRVLRKI